MKNSNTNIERVDLDYLHLVCDGSTEMIIELIDLFLKQTPIEIAKMYKCLEEEDWDTMNSTAHKTKSSVSILGIENLRNTVETIEVWTAQRKNLDKIPDLIQKVDKICTEIYDELNNIEL